MDFPLASCVLYLQLLILSVLHQLNLSSNTLEVYNFWSDLELIYCSYYKLIVVGITSSHGWILYKMCVFTLRAGV